MTRSRRKSPSTRSRATQLRRYLPEIALSLALLATIAFFGYLGVGLLPTAVPDTSFSGARALAQVETQLSFGHRISGTPNSRAMGDWLIGELQSLGWEVTVQEFTVVNQLPARNIIAARGQGPVATVGAHYDTRILADADPTPQLRTHPVPGANDGASGVAVLLELARILDVEATQHTVCLTFFDAEDNGQISGWDWIMGSRYYVENLHQVPRCNPPRFAVIVDMIGDADQQVYVETTGDARLSTAIWQEAAALGYGAWLIDEPRYSIIDDHTPFIEANIPAVDLIDFDYPYWHTTQDTLDKVSAESLERIGRTLQIWLEKGAPF